VQGLYPVLGIKQERSEMLLVAVSKLGDQQLRGI
jgi:hypothetical protein